jgi:hypothetical protein
MADSVRERVRRHREWARMNRLVRVEVEIPGYLLLARQPGESVKALLIRALTALLPRPPLPETLPETQPAPARPSPPAETPALPETDMEAAAARPEAVLPETLPETQARPLPEAKAVTGNAEVQFIALWQRGVETPAIAAALGISFAAAQSRARRLQQRGLIAPRPRGGSYPSQQAKSRPPRP